MKMNRFKYQDGGMNPANLNPEALSAMMSQQGAGQGVDYNGQPTPNVSGQPSFADMAQEIQERYDALIMPLQKKLEKLQKRFEENPSDQTIKNEINRIEQQIDSLEQKEDAELQQLEMQVQDTGQQIEQQKMAEGVDMAPQEQQMPEEAMPMMQKGGIFGDIKDWLKYQKNAMEKEGLKEWVRKRVFDEGDYRSFKQDVQDFPIEYQRLMEDKPVLGRIMQYNPLLGAQFAAMNFAAGNDEWKKNLARASFIPTAGLVSSLGIGKTASMLNSALLGGLGINAAANTAKTVQAKEMGLNGYYTGGLSGLLQDEGMKKKYADLVEMSIPIGYGVGSINPDRSALYANRVFGKPRRKNTASQETVSATDQASATTSGPTGKDALTDKEILQMAKNWFTGDWPVARKTGDIMARTVAYPFRLGFERPVRKFVSAFRDVEMPSLGKGYFRNIGHNPFTSQERTTMYQPVSHIRRIGRGLKGIGELSIPFGIGAGIYKYSKYDNPIDSVKSNSDYIYEYYDNLPQDVEKDYVYQEGGEVAEVGDDVRREQSSKKWIENLMSDYMKQNPTGIRGYIKDTPATEYVTWGNALGKLFDESGLKNIEAQNQYRYNMNPYTSVYDRANREYHEQLANTSRRYDIMNNELRRMQPRTEYGSMQQSFNARLAQDMLMRQQLSKNESDRQSALDAVRGSFGKAADEAYASMMEQNYKNKMMNENQRKMYLQALDSYNKEKQAQFDQVVNMLSVAGNRRKDIDQLNTFLFPNIMSAISSRASLEDIKMMLNLIQKGK